MYICQMCKKKPATIHLTDIHNNVKKEMHICESCASEKGFNLQGAANLPHLLGLAAKKAAAVSSAQSPVKRKEKAAEPELACPECGMTWSQFGDRGRLGCPRDYDAFDSRLRTLVGNQISPYAANRDVLHVGKMPGERQPPNARELTICGLQERLRHAVAEERYEDAADLKAELDRVRSDESDGI